MVSQARSVPVVRLDTRTEEAMGFRRRQGQHPLQLADHPNSDEADRLRGGARARPPGTPGPHARLLVYARPCDATKHAGKRCDGLGARWCGDLTFANSDALSLLVHHAAA